MIWIETKGTWFEIGQQYAGQAGPLLDEAIDHYAAWLKSDLQEHLPSIEKIRKKVKTHCPEVIEETAGMAERANLDETLMFGYRFFSEIGPWAPRHGPGCSCIFLPRAKEGTLLGRNSDLEPGNKVSTCHICRPENGPATVSMSYLGLAAYGTGMNSYGLAFGGASAKADGNFTEDGLSAAILGRILLGKCRSVDDAVEMLQSHLFYARSCIWIIADAAETAATVEFVPGKQPFITPMSPDKNWLACTNFFINAQLNTLHNTQKEIKYLDSAYARYGRIAHQLGEQIIPHTLPALKQLLIDIAQPGMCQPEDGILHTAHAAVCELKTLTMHVSEGHPANTSFKSVKL